MDEKTEEFLFPLLIPAVVPTGPGCHPSSLAEIEWPNLGFLRKICPTRGPSRQKWKKYVLLIYIY
jgi:hypothetical protein